MKPVCFWCKKEFDSDKLLTLYCSSECRQNARTADKERYVPKQTNKGKEKKK
jgi:hypothetical protein